MASAVNTIALSPNTGLSNRLAGIADSFDEYRFVRLRYRVLPPNGSQSTAHVITFAPGITDTAPTVTNVLEYLGTVQVTARMSVPSPWYDVPKGVLSGMHAWYKTVVGATDAADELQGNFFLAGGATDVVSIEIEGICQFRAAAAPGSTPMARAEAARCRERKRLLGVFDSSTAALVVAAARK